MSKSVDFQPNSPGIREFLRSEPVRALTQRCGEAVAARAGGNYETQTVMLDKKYIAVVRPADEKARRDNLKNNTLLKAIGAKLL